MFIRNCWYVAAWDEEIRSGSFHAITIINEPLVIYRTDEGAIVVLEDRCCHRSAPLSMGRIEDGCNVRCLYHGMKYDPSGQCIEVPGQKLIPKNARVRRYPAVARHSWVWVWMGDAGAADVNLIPDSVGYDDPRYVLRHGTLDYNASYQLINDNLTDFSHLSFVHTKSFGATERWASMRPSVKEIDRGIRVTRWFGADEPPIIANAYVSDGTGPTALFQTYDYLAPGILVMYSAFHLPEAVPEDRTSWPKAEPLSVKVDSQAVTPMTERTTRYFFSGGPRRVDGGAEVADAMMHMTRMAFEEDRQMIEAQQRNIDLRPATQILTGSDLGPRRMSAVMQRLAEMEQNPSQESGMDRRGHR